MRDADDGILAITSQAGTDRRHHTNRIGRLRKLESMGLAEELKPGVWRVAERAEQVLRDLGQRGDIMKTMQRVLKDAGLDRGASDYVAFDPAKSNSRVTGKVVAMGVSDELRDHHYIVVDGTDGKLHYAEIGRLSKYDPPSRDMVVTMRGHGPEKNRQSQQVLTRVFIESHVPFRELATAEGATWLDRKLLSRRPETYRERGFGSEANRALRLRQRWLVQEGLMTEQDRWVIARRRMLDELTRREVSKATATMAKTQNLENVEPAELGRSGVNIIRSVGLASGRFAVLQKGKQFALVPWGKAMRMRKDAGIGINAGRGISR